MNKKNIVVILLALFICSCASSKPKEDAEPELVTVTGRAYYAGSEPNVSMALNAFNGYALVLIAAEGEQENIVNLQNRIMTVKGYIDPAVNYPQMSIYVEEYEEIELTTTAGKLSRTGIGELSKYMLQASDKAYSIVAERIIQMNDLLDKEVYVDGYVFETDDSGFYIYLQRVRKKE